MRDEGLSWYIHDAHSSLDVITFIKNEFMSQKKGNAIAVIVFVVFPMIVVVIIGEYIFR